MKLLKLSALVASAVLSFNASADTDPLLDSIRNSQQGQLAEFLGPGADLAQWTANLPPPAGLIAIKLKTNQFMIMDMQMRYAFYANSIFDIANNRQVIEADDFNKMWHINGDSIIESDLPIFNFGVDKLRADFTVMLMAADSDATKATIGFIKEHMSDYRIDVLLIGSENRESLTAAANLYCAEDRVAAKERLLNLEFPVANDPSTHLKQILTCSPESILHAIQVAGMYGVKRLPFSYNANGAWIYGLPDDIPEFVKATEMNRAHIQMVGDIVNEVNGK